MDSRTAVAWVQLAIGAYYMQRTVRDWSAGRAAWKYAILPAVLSSAIGIEMLTSGWVRSAAWVLAGVGGAYAVAGMFQVRDRLGLWSNVVFCALALPIVGIELRFDDLAEWQRAIFAVVGVVFATLVVTATVRMIRSYRRVTLPSA